jgi:hypothetical protein
VISLSTFRFRAISTVLISAVINTAILMSELAATNIYHYMYTIEVYDLNANMRLPN